MTTTSGPWADAAKEFGDRLGRLRREAGLSQRELASRLNASNSTISTIESGKRPAPPDYKFVKRWVEQCAADARERGKPLSMTVELGWWRGEHRLLEQLHERSKPRRSAVGEEEVPTNTGPFTNLPPRNPAFTGRAELLDAIEARLLAGPVAVVAVRGLGGIGKSSLAAEYAHRGSDSGRYTIAWWVRADSPITLDADLAALAALLGIGDHADQAQARQALMRELSARDSWLLIFDNAEQPRDLGELRLPGNGHVLITSRYRAWTSIAAPVNIDAFTAQESIDFLIRRSGRNEPDAAASLAEELGHLPLALAQAASYADTYDTTLAHYLDLYHEATHRLLSTGLDPAEYPRSIATTWQLHVDRLQRDRPAALDLLRICAFLAPTAIPLDDVFSGQAPLPQSLLPAVTDRVERDETVGALVSTSLVTRLEDAFVQIHRLVQTVTRHQLDSERHAEYLLQAGSIVTAAMPTSASEPESWALDRTWSPHAIRVAEHAAPGDPARARWLFLSVAAGLYNQGQYDSAERVMIQAQSLPLTSEPNSEFRDRVLHWLSAAIKMKRGNLVAAQEDMRGLEEAAISAAHPDPQLAEMLITSAGNERRLGNLQAAARQLRLAFDIAEALGDQDTALVVLNDIALVHLEAGNSERAAEVFRKVLDWQTARYKPTDHRIGRTLGNLGQIHLALRDYPVARAALETALHILETDLGSDHPVVGDALNNLGQLHAVQGNFDEAERLLECALPILQARYGRRTADVVSVLAGLAQIRLHRGDREDAGRLATEAHGILLEVLGPQHPRTDLMRQILEATQRTR